MEPSDIIRNLVVPSYAEVSPTARAARFGTGLINQTYLVEQPEPSARGGIRRYILQRVNPIFDISIHDSIEAVTAHLQSRGVMTPRLIPTKGGALCLDLGEHGIWRLFNHVDGVSFDVIDTIGQARAAGAMVGRFHRALDDFDHPFTGKRLGVHDTPKHLARLREAIGAFPEHRLYGKVKVLGEAILAGASTLPPLPGLPDRVCHGDLKFNNILFAGPSGPAAEQPLCLIDLDTVGPMALAFEVGDAWRSWCNRNGENNPVAALDLEIFRSSLAGYKEGLGRNTTDGERQALLLGLDWVSLELAARFAADALFENYFGYDPEKFAGRGEHNLVRALGQWSLHQAIVAARPEREDLLGIGA